MVLFQTADSGKEQELSAEEDSLADDVEKISEYRWTTKHVFEELGRKNDDWGQLVFLL